MAELLNPFVPEPGAFAPLKRAGFRWLWPAVVVSYVGIWGQAVGAQWLLVDAPNASLMVALVQTAMTLPMMLFTLPGGVLADRFHKKWILLIVQVYVAVAAGTLAALAWLSLASPAIVLTFTFLIALGGAAQQPAWQAMLPEIVPRRELGAATRLEMVGVNFGRSLGPALAGLIIAAAGVPWVFIATAVTALYLAGFTLAWRPAHSGDSTPASEPFGAAIRAGIRFARHDSGTRRILLRTVLFIVPATVLWALIPLLARDVLEVGSAAYGFLFGALGAGAVVAALTVGRLRAVMTPNSMLTWAGVVYASVLVVVVVVPQFWVGLIALVLAGAGWTTVISTLNAELQVILPSWVRGHVIAIYLATFTGSQAVASILWGQIASALGLVPTFVLAAIMLVLATAFGFVLRLTQGDPVDAEARDAWGSVTLPTTLSTYTGPVLVHVEYTVRAELDVPFLAAARSLRRSRGRNGATRWELYRSLEHPNVYVEEFRVASWREHELQHFNRLTTSDWRIEESLREFLVTAPLARHFISPREDRRVGR